MNFLKLISPESRKTNSEDEIPTGSPRLELNVLLEEWKEARKSVDRFDNISVDLRKYGFTFITIILSTSSIVFDAATVKQPLTLLIIPIVIAVLTLSLFLADSYYQVMLLATVMHCRQLENIHKVSLDQEAKGQVYYGLNLSNVVFDRTQKAHAHLYVFVVYVLFLAISFFLGCFSLLTYQMNLQAPNIIPYMLGLVIAYLFIIIFIVMVSSGVSSLTTEMQKTELIDNRFVIRKEFEHAQVANATKRLAKEIHKRYENENFKILTLGMGGLYFVNKLIGELKWQNKVNVEFISAFSKREGEVVTIVPPDRSDLQNKHILIVDDLVSTGLTLKEAVAMCKGLGAQSVQTCVLLDAYNKRHSKCAGLTIDFAGLRSPERNLFFVGSGMDGGEKMSVESADKCRSLPYIGVIVAP